jgi:hypothetical protein
MQAWILPALQISGPTAGDRDKQQQRSSLYYAYCALYAVPLLRNGFDFLDGYSILMLLLCITHVQVF